MKKLKYTTILLFTIIFYNVNAQDTDDYIEFDDSQNTVHGVYLGLSAYYGEIEGESTYMFGGKVAYVANQQFEIGFAGVGFYTDQDSQGIISDD